ncbi:MAG TPA: YdcF family protein [Pyrinomonadaceae bacterium]|nr:YdcF family protein [Pyrinomonadaceae bacterium]
MSHNRIRLKRVAAWVAAVACAAFAAAFLAVSLGGLWDDARPSDVGIVLGNTVQPDGRPSERLRARLDKAVGLYRAGMFHDVIVSGGVGAEGFDEAEVMKRYLLEQGLPEDRVHADGRGLDTFETARNAHALMAARGWKSALVVSQYFHVPRCRLALRRVGVGEVSSAHADYFELRDLYSTCREVAAYPYYLARSY